MKMEYVDHLVLTVREMKKTSDFYNKILGMEVTVLPDERRELKFGRQKINLQEDGKPYGPASNYGRFWNGNLCFITKTPMEEILKILTDNNIVIEDGPGTRIGATGKIYSVYFRDPEQNLIEVSNHLDDNR